MIPNVPCAVTIRQHHDDHINETSEASSLVETSSLSESKLRQLFLEPKIINIIFYFKFSISTKRTVKKNHTQNTEKKIINLK